MNNVGVVMLRFRGAYTARDAQRSGIDAQRVYHVTGGQLIEHMGSAYDESLIASRFWSSLSAADHDRRVDALLFAKKPSDAQRALAVQSPG